MKSDAKSGFFKRRLEGIRRRWGTIAGEEYDRDTASLRPDLPPEDRPRILENMRGCLDESGGEIQNRARAAALGQTYLTLNPQGREAFLRMLAEEFDLREENVTLALKAYTSAHTPDARRAARVDLRMATESPRSRILTRFNALPQGVKFLVDLRSDLLPLAQRDPVLASLDDDLRYLLTAWFDVDFLELRRISWDTATGALLEKFMAYEAVHPVESWEDLKDRLDYDRRYYAFFHPRMPDEPLIFQEVALVKDVATNIQELLDPSAPTTDPNDADTAIFYSISNAQPGLAGVSFGGFLIKRVVDVLAAEFPRLETFATLSPVSGFTRWLRESWAACAANDTEDQPGTGFLPLEIKRLARVSSNPDSRCWLMDVVAESAWLEQPDLEKAVRPVLLRLAARYLVEERRQSGAALDLVAHFHLSNGARLERLNWAGDLSEKGLAQSAGIMANYLYDGRKIEANYEAYRGEGRVVTGAPVRALMKRS